MNFAPLFISFIIVLIIGPVLIKKLKELKAQQTEREIMESHVAKTGTPTMGGVAILCAVLITSLIFAVKNPQIYPVLILTIGFGLIGFIDDFLKVVLRRSDGLIAWQKMILQIAVTSVFALYIVKFSGVGLDILIPFTGGMSINIGWIALPILYFAVIGTVNGTNFTDGVDGLATTVTMIIAIFFAIRSIFGIPNFKQAIAAVIHIVLQQFHAVNAGDRNHRVFFIIQRAFAILPLDHSQFAPQDFR